VAALCAIALLVAGCGSSGDSSTKSGNSNASSAAPAPKGPAGDPIKIGTICSCSGPQSAALGKSSDVLQAYVNTVNANGGINGHPVKLSVEDDGGQPAKAQAAAKKLVEQDKVVAIVGTTSSPAETWAKYVEGKGVPVIGGNGFLSPFLSSADWYPVGGQLPVLLFGVAKTAKAIGSKKLGAVYCAETPVCAQLGGLVSAIGKTEGLEVQTGKAGVAQPNFTALCLSLKQGGVDSLAVAQSAPTVVRVHQSCAQQGYNPTPLNYTSGSSPAWYKDPNLNNKMKLIGGEANYQDTSIPAVKTFQGAMDKYIPGFRTSDQFAYSGTWDVWVSGLLFDKAAEAAKLTPTSTPADLKKGLYTIKNDTLEGATVPLTFTPDKPTLLPCYYNQEIKDGQIATSDPKPTCLSTTELTALGTILTGGK
jgi:branched-chain amino acid transport system substrate-binding protein